MPKEILSFSISLLCFLKLKPDNSFVKVTVNIMIRRSDISFVLAVNCVQIKHANFVL